MIAPFGRRIRIAFIIDRVFSCQAGTEQQLLRMIQSLDKQQFEVFLCCLRDTEFLRNVDHCNVHICKVDSLFSLNGLKSAVSFVHFLKREGIDIVQTFFKDGNLFGIFCAKIANVPVIISSRRGQVYWRGGAGYRLIRLTNAMTDHFFANSRAVEQFLINHEKIEPSRIEVIANSIDTDLFRKALALSVEECRLRLSLTKQEFVVGIVAGLRKVKRHDLFIHAAAKLCAVDNAWRFVVVGSGNLDEELKAMVRELGLEGAFSFLGLRQDSLDIIRAFDVGVLCSDFESTSNALLEYIAMKVPVVCTQVGDNALYVEEGRNGFVVKPNNPGDLAAAIRRVRVGSVDPSCLLAKSEFILTNFNAQQIHCHYQESYLRLYDASR